VPDGSSTRLRVSPLRSAARWAAGCSGTRRWWRPRRPGARRVLPARRGPARADLAGRLAGRRRGEAHDGRDPVAVAEALDGDEESPPPRWKHLDVGSPFDYRSQSQLWIARDLPDPAGWRCPGRRRSTSCSSSWSRPPEAARWAVQLHGGSRRARRGGARGDRPADPAAGRRLARGAAAPLRLRRADLPVRHAVVLAGRGHPGQRLPAGGHRPHPLRHLDDPLSKARLAAAATPGATASWR
jgi:hypothetical protein